MTASETIAATVLAFDEATFADAPHSRIGDRVGALADTGFVGIAINAPATQPEPGDVPIAVAVRHDGARGWDMPLDRNALLVAEHLSTGRVRLGKPFGRVDAHGPKRHHGEAPLDRGPRPPDEQLEGMHSDVAWSGTRRAGLKVAPGDWRFTILWFDWRSNDVRTRIAGEVEGRPPPPVFPEPHGEGRVPSFLPQGDPLPPDHDGSLRLLVQEGEDGRQQALARAVVRGAVKPWMLARGTLVDGGEARTYGAVVPLHVILMERNRRSHVFRLGVPVYGQDVAAGEQVTIHATLDLVAGSDYLLPPGDYAAHLVSPWGLYGTQRLSVETGGANP